MKSKWVEVALFVSAAVLITLGLLATFGLLQFNGTAPFSNAMFAAGTLLALLALSKFVTQACIQKDNGERSSPKTPLVADAFEVEPPTRQQQPLSSAPSLPPIVVQAKARVNVEAPTLAELQRNPDLFESRALNDDEIAELRKYTLEKLETVIRDEHINGLGTSFVQTLIVDHCMKIEAFKQNPYSYIKELASQPPYKLETLELRAINWILAKVWEIQKRDAVQQPSPPLRAPTPHLSQRQPSAPPSSNLVNAQQPKPRVNVEAPGWKELRRSPHLFKSAPLTNEQLPEIRTVFDRKLSTNHCLRNTFLKMCLEKLRDQCLASEEFKQNPYEYMRTLKLKSLDERVDLRDDGDDEVLIGACELVLTKIWELQRNLIF